MFISPHTYYITMCDASNVTLDQMGGCVLRTCVNANAHLQLPLRQVSDNKDVHGTEQTQGKSGHFSHMTIAISYRQTTDYHVRITYCFHLWHTFDTQYDVGQTTYIANKTTTPTNNALLHTLKTSYFLAISSNFMCRLFKKSIT